MDRKIYALGCALAVLFTLGSGGLVAAEGAPSSDAEPVVEPGETIDIEEGEIESVELEEKAVDEVTEVSTDGHENMYVEFEQTDAGDVEFVVVKEE